jgi:zinc protease
MPGLIALNRQLIEEFYFDQVRPETMVVVVSGDVDAELVEQMVRTYVEDWDIRGLRLPADAAGYFTEERFGDPVRQPASPVRLAERLRSQSAMVANWPTVPRTHPDRAAFAVLAEITGGLGGTFFEEIRTRRGLAYQVSTFNRNQMLAGEFSVFVACTPDSVETVRELVTSLTRSLATEPPTREQLDRAKAALVGAWQIGGQTNGARVGRLATFELSGQSPDQLRVWPEQIQAVTVDDLRRVATTWLDRPPLATGIVAGTLGSDANPNR